MMSVVNDMFTFVTLDNQDTQYAYDLFVKIKAIAEHLEKTLPKCNETTLAMRSLHLSLLHAGTAIEKQEKYRV